MSQLQGMPLVNIKRVEIITEEDTPKTYTWETADKAKVSPEISKGKETTLRIKDTIYANNRTEDIVIGYNLEFQDNMFIPQVFALVDGGTLTFDEDDETNVIAYEGPEIGVVVKRTKFTLNVYTEEKDVDGETLKYAKFIYKHCKGKPAEYDIEDGKFMVPKLKMESRPKKGEKPVKIEFVDKLPAS